MKIPFLDLHAQHWSLQPAVGFLNYQPGDFPMAERCASELISLPMDPELTDRQIQYVAEVIGNFVESHEGIMAPKG